MKKIIHNGFTLAEILVTLGVSSVILLVLTQIFFSSIRGSNKSQLITVINQSGKNILDMLEKNVRNADLILCPRITSNDVSAGTNVLVLLQSGKYFRYRLYPYDNPTGLVRDEPEPTDTEAKDLNLFVSTLCTISNVDSSNLISLTDENMQTGLKISAPEGSSVFTRNKIVGKNKDTLSIKFNLEPAGQSVINIPGKIDPILFSTTVEIR